MPYRKTILHSVATLFLTTLAYQSHAVGLGFSIGTGSEKWEQDRVHVGDRDIRNMGFIVDTAVARDKLFNYRFTFLKEENNATDAGRLDMDGYAMTHDFGFGVIRSKQIRLWLGPQLKGSFYDDLYINSTNTRISDDVIGFGFGPVLGLNVHVPQVVSFSFTAAYHMFSAYSGDYASGDSLDADSTGLYFNAALIFRINE
jgi:hypothetical protein